MRSPSLAELPAPPPGRTGWPWTEESPRCDMEKAPRISIVTPSYMQGRFIEQTIRAVLLQGWPDVEYFVLDGGSTDETRAVIGKYAPWLAGWRSERDTGQSAAINEGWAKATGGIRAWINSDDWYLPGAFQAAAAALSAGHEWAVGGVDDCEEDGRLIKQHTAKPVRFDEVLGRHNYCLNQPGLFWTKRFLEAVGPLNPEMHYSFDHDLCIRGLAAGMEPELIAQPVAAFRRHLATKSAGARRGFIAEDWRIFHTHAAKLDPAARARSRAWLRAYEADGIVTTAYGLVVNGRRGTAFSYLLRKLGLFPAMPDKMAYLVALARIVLGTRPPAWFAPRG